MLSASAEDVAGYGVRFEATHWFTLSKEQVVGAFKKLLLIDLVEVLFKKWMWLWDKMLPLP